jgi:hypothetical protein
LTDIADRNVGFEGELDVGAGINEGFEKFESLVEVLAWGD